MATNAMLLCVMLIGIVWWAGWWRGGLHGCGSVAHLSLQLLEQHGRGRKRALSHEE